MLSKGILVYRKKLMAFNSFENVFNVLQPLLSIEKVELPFSSSGLVSRLKNIRFIIGKVSPFIHITGHDHYLLWWPFKNTILTIHDIEALKRKKGIKRWIFKKLWFDIPIHNAALVTTISEFTKRELLSLTDYKTPIYVIHNPLTLSLTYSLKPFNCHCPRILHIGTKANKNLPRLIEALEGITCELIIIGQSSLKLEQLLGHYRIAYQIKTGLSSEEVMAEYKMSDIVSFVSTYEGFGLPILEAQSVGRPVITSNVASMPEVAGEGALFVNPFSVDSIKKGVTNVMQNESLRNDLIKKGLENVSKYEKQNIANQYIELYSKVLIRE